MKQKNPKVMREARDFSHVRFTIIIIIIKITITKKITKKIKMYKAKIKELLGVA